MLPRLSRLLLVGALLVGVLGLGCQRASSGGDTLAARDTTLIDALGRRLSLRLPAQRAMSLAPNLTEIAFAAGAGDRLAGVTTADDFPASVQSLPRVQAYPQIDFEAIAALRPDLVLATDQVNAARDAQTLSAALDAPTYFFSFSSLGDVFDAVERTGRLLGTPRRGARAADSLRRALRRVRRRTTEAQRRPLVLFLIGDETLFTFAEGSYVHAMIRAAGGRSATANLPTASPLSETFVLETQPDVIVGAFGSDYDPARLGELHPAWRGAVPALENGRVHGVASPLFLRPGPRVVEGTRRLARLLHPELFAQ